MLDLHIKPRIINMGVPDLATDFPCRLGHAMVDQRASCMVVYI